MGSHGGGVGGQEFRESKDLSEVVNLLLSNSE